MKERALTLLITFSIVLTGCGIRSTSSNVLKSTRTIFAMDTIMDLTIYGSDEVLNECEETIHFLEKELSTTDENSQIFILNNKKTSLIEDNAASLIKSSISLCEKTNGALDISIYPIVKAWGFTTEEYKIPDNDTLRSLLTHVGYRNIQLTPAASSGDVLVSLDNDASIDLGSVAKGYTGDLLIRQLTDKGVQSALLNLGGNVQALGCKPDGAKWKIAIQDPDDLNQYLGSLEIANQAVITSGGYQRYFEEGGKRYHHIINPSTGHPADNGLISVTIVGDNGFYCDGLSTALFVMGLDKAIAFWREYQDFEAIFVSDDNMVYITAGLDGNFSLLAKKRLEVIK